MVRVRGGRRGISIFMKTKDSKKKDSAQLKIIEGKLDDLYVALGMSVIMVQQTQKALKKDKVTMRVNALQVRESFRELQRQQRVLFAALKKIGVEA